ncbi:MAG TPA: hypothetical protein VKB12_20240 [Pyrinomonadaceae bacterium]|nr:hypothetical protein [Pyrinomonadaceae bacterium]
MRKPAILSALAACALAAACGAPGPTAKTTNTNSQASNTQTSIAHGTNTSPDAGVAASHGGASQPGASGASATKPPVETPELDAKVEKAESKAKAAGASDADKKAAARAYFERADFFRGEGSPVLYKFALADYRRGLRYDPTNEDARRKMDEIVGIYKSMGRPVPELGNEQ